MVKKVTEDAFREVLDIVATHSDDISVSSIAEKLSNDIPRRTLQYRLKQLVTIGRLRLTGSGRGAKYRLVKTDALTLTELDQQEEAYNHFIALSEGGHKVRNYVRQSVFARKPVGYNRDFLDQYRPNETFYLEEQERNHLRQIGEMQTARQPAGTYARYILNRLLIDLAWNSSRLEGNTYSLIDTRRLIEFGEEAAGRDHTETQMILNHKDAIEFLVEYADKIDFNRHSIFNLHALLSNNLLANRAASGRLRSIAIGIGQSAFHPLEIPQLIEEYFAQILFKAASIKDPFEQAFFVLVHIPYLQPFEDVNRRVSRLAANIPLIRNNFAPLSFADVPKDIYTEATLGVYELNDIALLKDVFLSVYERSVAKYISVQQALGEPDVFRLKYQAELREIIAKLIRTRVGRAQATTEIAQWAENRIKIDDQDAFVEVVEEELIGLHDGNFARYKVQPSEYAVWQDVWTTK